MRIARVFSEVEKTLAKFENLSTDKLKEICRIQKDAGILKVFGSILKINQGIESDPYLFMNKLLSIERYIAKAVHENEVEYDTSLFTEKDSDVFSFSFVRFLTDP